jgi:peptide/nickel transport system substrate-binding protein
MSGARRHFIILVALLGACGGRARRTPDDTLVWVLEQSVKTLDPRDVLSNHETKISRLVAAPLASVDQPSMEPMLVLAEAVEPVDERTWDVTLRPGLHFADGAPVTARDVAYTFQSTLDPARHAVNQRAFGERLISVEALDDRRARFHLTAPFATFVTDLDYGIVEEAADRAGRPFVGAGPYRVVSADDREVVLERNDFYTPRPPLRRLVFRTFTDVNARLLVLVGGSADGMLNGTRLDLLGRLADTPRLRVETAPSALLTYLLMNNDDPTLADPRVRRAIAHAIDRAKIVAGKLGGHAVLATGLLAPGHWAYSADVPTYPYDPARARALLDEAGLRPGPDGVRLRLSYKTSSDQMRIAIARLIAQDLADVGIEVEVRSFEFATVFADMKKGNYQLATLQTGDIAEPDMYYVYFHSARIPTPAQPDLANRWHYRSAEADRLIEAGRHTLDRAARKRIYAELQRTIAADEPIVPLWHEDNVAVLNRDVMGFELLPNARISSLARVWKR